MIKRAAYTDAKGLNWWAHVPIDAPEDKYKLGVLEGPPDFSDFGLPQEVATRLHNELFALGIMTYAQARTRRQTILEAYMHAIRADIDQIVEGYNRGKS